MLKNKYFNLLYLFKIIFGSNADYFLDKKYISESVKVLSVYGINWKYITIE